MAAIKKYNKKLGFDINNSYETGVRTYGFIKTKRCDTPIPAARHTLETNELSNRINSVHSNFGVSEHDTDSDVSKDDTCSKKVSSISVKSIKGLTPFEKKRQMFDAAEFTITRGRKLSKDFHPVNPGFYRPGSFEANSIMFEELQNMCHKMNCKLTK
ncbi:uncharacterized protein Dana_GF27208 [Drosophila ananassae]|uniref:Uncharacterized protein n=1 Tax=Drosophila ananassae TaxID=7217 RepID=A0A0P8YN03_DROAN|nr:uncharacterized protein LOC26514617 [Drosophila ananassae]KPU80170.1 uncharacterized protein Dana_GF27208 [Drosophila ananassae]